MKNFYFIILTLLVAVISPLAQAQNKGNISGIVKDNLGTPQEFVTIMLIQAHDSAFVKGAATDIQGKYSFEAISEGKYLVAATQVGFRKTFSESFEVDGRQTNITVPDLSMAEDVTQLKEVKVVSTKPFVEQEIDRMVINVENSIVSSGNNALEVLEKAPGVTIDRQNDQIMLKGKSGVIVMIDGKQTYLSSQDVANLLRNTMSENIEKIEIITNPSSKYDASGNTGIINIRMKKNKNFGTNGTASLGAGYGRFEKSEGSLQLNHRVGKINAFGNTGYYYRKSFQTNTLSRIIPHNGTVTYSDEDSYRPNQFNGLNYRAGVDYFISNKSTLGVLVTGFDNSWKQFNAENKTVISDENRVVTLRPLTVVDIDNEWSNLTGNLNYKYDFDGKGKEFTIDMDYSVYDRGGDSHLTTDYRDANNATTRPLEIVRNTMPSDIDIWAVKADYVLPLKNGGKWEAGAKSSLVQSDNNLIYEDFLDNRWINDVTKSNRFKYKENINAAYINFGTKIDKKTSVQMGLRAEQTVAEGNSVTLNEKIKREYTNLFPTFFLSRQLDSSNVLNLSYSRRVDRPNYQNLNPFRFYLNPYTFQVGNPDLQPQFTHSVQLTHTYKNTLSTSLSYSRTTDVIIHEVPGQIAEDSLTFVKADNLERMDNLNLTISSPIKVKNWWTIQSNLSIYYNKLNSDYLDAEFNIDVVAWNAYVSNNIILGGGFSAEVSGWYNSKGFYGFYSFEPQGAVNLGLQKTFMDKKLTLKANVNDPFWSNKFKGHAKYEEIDFKIRSTWESRVARLTLTYRFGNQNVKGARQRSTSTEAERNRAGN